MAESQDNSWRTQSFRQNVRGKIEEAIRQSGNPTTKSVAEMENHVFQKAKTKEEYLGFVARLIIHVREMSGRKIQNEDLFKVDEDSDSDSSSSNSDSEIETYVDDDTIEETDEDEDCEGALNGAASGIGTQRQKQGTQPIASQSNAKPPQGVKRKRIDMEKRSSVDSSEKWNSQMNEYEAVGVNVYKKLQRMEPLQALYAETLITKVLRHGLLNSLTPETDVSMRQYGQEFVSSVSTLCNSLENHPATPMYVNTPQSVGNCTFSNTVPLSTSFPAITTSSSGFVTEHGSVNNQFGNNLHESALTLQTPNAVGEDQNSLQNNASTVIQSPVITFKAESGLNDNMS